MTGISFVSAATGQRPLQAAAAHRPLLNVCAGCPDVDFFTWLPPPLLDAVLEAPWQTSAQSDKFSGKLEQP